jgi:signal transduction histidine kinase
MNLNAQISDSLYIKFLASQNIADPVHRDSSMINAYKAYVLYMINEDDPKTESMLDSLHELTSSSEWDKAEGIYLRVRARMYDRQGDMDKALQFYNLAIDTLQHTGPDYVDISSTKIGLGFVLLNTQLYEKALESLKEGYSYAKLSGYLRNQILTLNFFGDYYYYSAFGQENLDSSLFYYLETDKLIKENGITGYFKADNDLGLADVYRRLGKSELSEMYFESSLEEALKFNNYDVIYALYVDKGEVYEERGEFEKALELKQEAYKYVQASGWIEFIARADQQLYQTYRLVGDYENALIHFEKYYTSQDSMNKVAATNRYAELEVKFESQEREEEITRLENKNLQQKSKFLIGFSILAAILLSLISILNLRLRKNIKELAKKNKEILLAQLKGQNIERERMAAELHDNLNTKIAAVRWLLESVNPSVNEKSQKILNKTLELVNDIYDDVRLISHNLMPEKVEALGLIPALESLLAQLNQNNKVKFSLVTDTTPGFDFGPLTYQIYNIVFEMINNILKHADAKNGWISISEEKESILLTVSDDGRGFDINNFSGGYGIKSITSRLEVIKGKWNIESSIGKGTKFLIEIPRI